MLTFHVIGCTQPNFQSKWVTIKQYFRFFDPRRIYIQLFMPDETFP